MLFRNVVGGRKSAGIDGAIMYGTGTSKERISRSSTFKTLSQDESPWRNGNDGGRKSVLRKNRIWKRNPLVLF